uniref:SANT domain-containing protein n=1 Tax=Timema monikensis TaxID=170555 RepID=A0A7R9EKN5_9NEOP|nr:unnamed protein product [Timema monikensis]
MYLILSSPKGLDLVRGPDGLAFQFVYQLLYNLFIIFIIIIRRFHLYGSSGTSSSIPVDLSKHLPQPCVSSPLLKTYYNGGHDIYRSLPCNCMDPSLTASGVVETPNLISVNSPDVPVDKCEQLGSVTHNQETDGLITGQIRSSARVYKKMRLDSGSLSTALEKKDPKDDDAKPDTKDKIEHKDKLDCKQPEIKPKPNKPQLWSTEEKNIFFEALNEYGKDFESISNYFATKARKKGMPESMSKTKDQVRHFYYRAWHKVSKHLKFPEDPGNTHSNIPEDPCNKHANIPEDPGNKHANIPEDPGNKHSNIPEDPGNKHSNIPEDPGMKKATQELYSLINYGEMRRKIGPITEKLCLKLNELVYRGSVQIRLKGKTIRIKTPMCRILRKLNQLDGPHNIVPMKHLPLMSSRPTENEEEVRLPNRISIELRPKTNTAWGRVQSVAQNPRVRTKLPLQRRLASLLTFLENRWKQNHVRHREKLAADISAADPGHAGDPGVKETLLRVAPRPDASISLSAVNMSEYLTSLNLCLNTYQERFGFQPLDDPSFGRDRSKHLACRKALAKKAKTEPGAAPVKPKEAKTEPGAAPAKPKEAPISVDTEQPSAVGPTTPLQVLLEFDNNACDSDPRTLEAMDASTISANDMAVNNILSLKLCLDAESPVTPELVLKEEPVKEEQPTPVEAPGPDDEETLAKIRAGWTRLTAKTTTIGDLYLLFGFDGKLHLDYCWEGALSHPTSQSEEGDRLQGPTPNPLAGTLQQLVSIAKLNVTKNKVTCPCGHICGVPNKSSPSGRNRMPPRARPIGDSADRAGGIKDGGGGLHNHVLSRPVSGDGVFRIPLLAPSQFKPPPKPGTAEAFKAQLDKFRPRFCNRRGRAVRPKNVVVQRQLPLLPKAPNGHAMVTLKVIPQTGEFMPIGGPTGLVAASHSSGVVFPSGVMPRPPVKSRHILPALPVVTTPPPNTSPLLSDTSPAGAKEELLQPASPPSISHLLNLPVGEGDHISLVTPSTSLLDPPHTGGQTFEGFLPTAGELVNSTPPSSPSRIFKEDSQWLNSEVADFSLSSFLGHLESPMKPSTLVTSAPSGEDTRLSSDVEAQLQCLMSENSVDYTAKFADLAAQIASSSDANKK